MTTEGCITEQRCREKYPEATYTQVIRYDTTIITHSSHFDTLFHYEGADTVYLKDAKTQIQVKLIRVRDSIYVYGECPPDTITIEKVRSETTFERAKNLFQSELGNYFWIILLALIVPVLALLYMIMRIFKR